MFHRFIFATGIENSMPVIENGRKRMDELEKCAPSYPYFFFRTKIGRMSICFIIAGS
jgi:hypothetical protein